MVIQKIWILPSLNVHCAKIPTQHNKNKILKLCLGNFNKKKKIGIKKIFQRTRVSSWFGTKKKKERIRAHEANREMIKETFLYRFLLVSFLFPYPAVVFLIPWTFIALYWYWWSKRNHWLQILLFPILFIVMQIHLEFPYLPWFSMVKDCKLCWFCDLPFFLCGREKNMKLWFLLCK